MLFFFSFPDELILFKKRQSTTADIAEKVGLSYVVLQVREFVSK